MDCEVKGMDNRRDTIIFQILAISTVVLFTACLLWENGYRELAFVMVLGLPGVIFFYLLSERRNRR